MPVNSILCRLLVVISCCAAFGAARAMAAEKGCDEIVFEIDGSAPDLLETEFAAAREEIRSRSGIVIRPRSSVGDEAGGRLVLRWSEQPLPPSATAEATGLALRPLARSRAVWREDGARPGLVSATIVVDGTWPWTGGLGAGDTLASALVHELGHVLGVEHSPDSTSYMFAVTSPTPREWTEHDLAQLQRLAVDLGCQQQVGP